MENPLEIVEETVDAIIDEVEHPFSPRPGGMVDRHRKEKARREAAQKEAEQENERVEEFTYKAVKTVTLKPEITSILNVTVPANGSAMILPLGPYRYRAIIRVTTAATTVTLGRDSGQALSGLGYPLATADPPMVIESRAQLWAGNATGSAIQVVAYVERFSPET